LLPKGPHHAWADERGSAAAPAITTEATRALTLFMFIFSMYKLIIKRLISKPLSKSQEKQYQSSLILANINLDMFI
jgi:hypothetical protein